MTIDQEIASFADRARRGRFDGDDYVPGRDDPRLRAQVFRIFVAMIGGDWRTLREIAQITGDPEASISAQLRHLRKPRFGRYVLTKRHRGDPAAGLYEYRLEFPKAEDPVQEALF